jgi:hypothetical protein
MQKTFHFTHFTETMSDLDTESSDYVDSDTSEESDSVNSYFVVHPDADVEFGECTYKQSCTCRKCVKKFYEDMEDYMIEWEDEKLKWEAYMKTCSCRNVPAREECMPDCIVLEHYNKHIRNKPVRYGNVLY